MSNIAILELLYSIEGPLTIKYVISQIVGVKFLVIPFAFNFAFKMHIKEKSVQHSIN